MKLLAPFALLTTALLTTTAMAAPDVVASIKPVHSLVASVMAGVGEPTLIVKGSASPHTYALKPSDAGALESADIVFWTGHGMELFLGDALETLATGATVVELADSPGITLLPVREGGAFEAHSHEGEGHEAHDHEHEEHDHEHGEGDMHFWLDPENAKLMVTQIATTLAEADPENATAYQANAEAELVKLDELKAKVAELGATCVFAEPNFEPTIIAAITEGSAAQSGVLDPEGGALGEGPELYPTLLRGLAASLVDCLQ